MKKRTTQLGRSLCVMLFMYSFLMLPFSYLFHSSHPSVAVLSLEKDKSSTDDGIGLKTICSYNTDTFYDLIFWESTTPSSNTLISKASLPNDNLLRRILLKLGNFFKVIPIDKIDYAEFDPVSEKLMIQVNGILLPEIEMSNENFNNIFGSIDKFKKVNEKVYANHSKAMIDVPCSGVYIGEKYFEFTFSCCRSIWCDR